VYMQHNCVYYCDTCRNEPHLVLEGQAAGLVGQLVVAGVEGDGGDLFFLARGVEGGAYAVG
jgi:hypothetical protein